MSKTLPADVLLDEMLALFPDCSGGAEEFERVLVRYVDEVRSGLLRDKSSLFPGEIAARDQELALREDHLSRVRNYLNERKGVSNG